MIEIDFIYSTFHIDGPPKHKNHSLAEFRYQLVSAAGKFAVTYLIFFDYLWKFVNYSNYISKLDKGEGSTKS